MLLIEGVGACELAELISVSACISSRRLHAIGVRLRVMWAPLIIFPGPPFPIKFCFLS